MTTRYRIAAAEALFSARVGATGRPVATKILPLLAARRLLHGYRMMHAQLRRRAFIVNHKKAYRIYKEVTSET